MLEMNERSASWFGIEMRHPFFDRRVAAFALALPGDQRRRSDQTKFVLRQAMRGLLPETVRRRRTKAELSPFLAKVFAAHGGEQPFASLATAEAGWVDGPQVRRMYRQMAQRFARGEHGNIWPLWMVAGIDLWLKQTVEWRGERGSPRPGNVVN